MSEFLLLHAPHFFHTKLKIAFHKNKTTPRVLHPPRSDGTLRRSRSHLQSWTSSPHKQALHDHHRNFPHLKHYLNLGSPRFQHPPHCQARSREIRTLARKVL